MTKAELIAELKKNATTLARPAGPVQNLLKELESNKPISYVAVTSALNLMGAHDLAKKIERKGFV